MWTRRQFVQGSCGAILSALGGAPLAPGADRESLPDGAAAKNMITPAAQQAIDQGLAYLSRCQHVDGSFGTVQHQGNIAITSLAGLAMMAGGHHPGRGSYGDVVTKALRYVLDQNNGGYLVSRTGYSHGPMYGHGFGTLFLAEVHGMVHDKELRERLRTTLKQAIQLIQNSQNSEGGWRYMPSSKDADVSVTICQIMALRAARNAGFYVAKSTVDRCISYVKRCQDRGDGGFHYQLHGGPSQFARSAAGVVALHCAGVYKGPEVESGLRYLMQFKPNAESIRPDVHLHYYYGHYYAAQAMWTAGDPYWKEWYPAIREELINHPGRPLHGCWTDQRFGYDYATAMACIILQIPNNYLPILQK
ncbi:MAG TPA: prenyltransferase/squalene oxidase repeat-containing protein [Gemmataceae bacterium]|nr:prenyltransferase/squalene oxidase repeat-containing protein [Gemmataceae bacterium]